MFRFIMLGGLLAVFIALGAILTIKLPKSAAAAHHSVEAINPMPLHGALQRAKSEMWLP
jgi:hypothetical protein